MFQDRKTCRQENKSSTPFGDALHSHSFHPLFLPALRSPIIIPSFLPSHYTWLPQHHLPGECMIHLYVPHFFSCPIISCSNQYVSCMLMATKALTLCIYFWKIALNGLCLLNGPCVCVPLCVVCCVPPSPSL